MVNFGPNRITPETPSVSIVVNNYNYAKFLQAAIDSALGQTYPWKEVLVVDDGSTDDSRQIIADYGSRISSILKPNGGQASAFNAGFARSSGEIILFLDADDILHPGIVERVVAAFRVDPLAARVQYRLAIVDAAGNPTGTFVPPAYLPLASGDLRQKLPALMNGTNWSPTTGNAFAAWTLRHILPMPFAEFKTCADYYLLRANALYGPVVALEEAGAYYRSHGKNSYLAAELDVKAIRRQIALTQTTHRYIQIFAEKMGLHGQFSNAVERYDEIFLAQRIISLKLDACNHPVAEDKILSLFWRGANAALQRMDLSPLLKLLHICWFVIMLLAPRRVAHPISQLLLPGSRPGLNQVLHGLLSPTPVTR
jgi:glycosyltransferase involved in cell wall biosynthesis